MNAIKSKQYLSPQEVARMFMVSPITVRSWAEKGWLSAEVTVGGHRRYLQEEVDRFALERGVSVKREGPEVLQILIVDDDRQLAGLLNEVFKDVYPPVETRVAHDGFEAGLLVHELKPDVVLLDLMMPGLDGFQVCQRIKSIPSLSGIRVIAMTGFPSDENVVRIMIAGAEACLNKPLDMKALFNLLRVQRLSAS